MTEEELKKEVRELVESIWFDGENGGFDGSSVHEWYQKESKEAQKEYVKDILKLLANQRAKLFEQIRSEAVTLNNGELDKAFWEGKAIPLEALTRLEKENE